MHTRHLLGMLCAICASNPAQVPDVLDGKTVVVCIPCRDAEVAPPPPAPTVPERVLRLVQQSPGTTVDELAMVIDDSEEGRLKIQKALQRHRVADRVSQVRDGNDYRYYPVGPRLGYRTHQAGRAR